MSCEALPNMWIRKFAKVPSHLMAFWVPTTSNENNSPARQWLRENERNISLQIVNTFVWGFPPTNSPSYVLQNPQAVPNGPYLGSGF